MTVGRLVLAVLAAFTASIGQGAEPGWTRAEWIALAESGFAVPADRHAFDLLVEMNELLFSSDPVLRDDVAYVAAERWILRDAALSPQELRDILALWTANLDRGLGASGDGVFGRSFSALCLSLVAAADLRTPFLAAGEVEAFLTRMLDYFVRERDLRGFDPERGWMHSVAHTADALKFLARNPKLGSGTDRRILDAVRARIAATDSVFAWGENDRVALAVYAAVRRPDADPKALATWLETWVADHGRLWAKGPQVDPVAFARVENAKQILRGVFVAASLDPVAPPGELTQEIGRALARMR